MAAALWLPSFRPAAAYVLLLPCPALLLPNYKPAVLLPNYKPAALLPCDCCGPAVLRSCGPAVLRPCVFKDTTGRALCPKNRLRRRRESRETSLSLLPISYLLRTKNREESSPNCLSDKGREQVRAGDEKKNEKKLPYYLFYSVFVLFLYCH
jgi:hypothetical protein